MKIIAEYQLSLRISSSFGFHFSQLLFYGTSLLPFICFYKLFYFPFSCFQDAKELIKEIAVLELEVKYLEQYILSLYRKNFDERMKSASEAQEGKFSEASQYDITSEKENSRIQISNSASCRYSSNDPPKKCNDNWQPQELLDAGIRRSHSSLSHHSACSIRASSPIKSLDKAVDSYHSLPLSMLEVINVPL